MQYQHVLHTRACQLADVVVLGVVLPGGHLQSLLVNDFVGLLTPLGRILPLAHCWPLL